MTKPASGEDLEAAGPRWKGGVEWTEFWNDYVRHWWRFHPQDPILTHRASGEQVVHVGLLPEPNWHLFEYRHGETVYPIAVEMRGVWWPNPDPDRYAGPPYNVGSQPELRLHVWRVDHLRSARLWRSVGTPKSNADQPPPYWLWRRIDNAIVDAALLWPKAYPSKLKAADEVAIEGGWLNGQWRVSFFRRLRHYEDFDQLRDIFYFRSRPERAIHGLGLPLTDFNLEQVDASPPRWERVCGSAFDLYGEKTYRQTLMREPVQDAALTLSTGSIRSMERLRWPVIAVAREQTIWSSQVQAYGSRPYGHALSAGTPVEISSDWTVYLDRFCTIARTSGDPGPVAVSWLERPVLPFDGMTRGEIPSYDPAVITHVLSSYGSWRFVYDSLLNALPFCPGFAEQDFESVIVLVDCGQLNIVGGFVGGIQRLTTEARLKLELPSDTEATTWSKFFA